MIRTFLIKDIDYKIVVEPSTRKEILSYLDEYLENLEYDFFDLLASGDFRHSGDADIFLDH